MCSNGAGAVREGLTDAVTLRDEVADFDCPTTSAKKKERQSRAMHIFLGVERKVSGLEKRGDVVSKP
jgi:hypothetical protein